MKESLLHEDLVLLDCTAENREELLRKMAAILEEKGYVKSSYANAIIERENVYPTGLNTLNVKVAMPHTSPEHVNQAAILVAKLMNPVIFNEMGNNESEVKAKLIFMLAVTDPKGHLEALGKLMTIFSDGEKLLDLYESDSAGEIVAKLAQIMA